MAKMCSALFDSRIFFLNRGAAFPIRLPSFFAFPALLMADEAGCATLGLVPPLVSHLAKPKLQWPPPTPLTFLFRILASVSLVFFRCEGIRTLPSLALPAFLCIRCGPGRTVKRFSGPFRYEPRYLFVSATSSSAFRSFLRLPAGMSYRPPAVLPTPRRAGGCRFSCWTSSPSFADIFSRGLRSVAAPCRKIYDPFFPPSTTAISTRRLPYL